MSLSMSNDEICRDYRLSKNKNHQVGVLAELNATSPERILEILAGGGEISGTPQHKAAAKEKSPVTQKEAKKPNRRQSAELRLEQYVGLADKGFTVAETAEAMDVTPGAVWSFAKKHGIRFAGMRDDKRKSRPVTATHESGKEKASADSLHPQPEHVNLSTPPKEEPKTVGACAAGTGGLDMIEAMRQMLYLMPEIVGGDAAVTACSANRSTAVVIAETGGKCWRLSLAEEMDAAM